MRCAFLTIVLFIAKTTLAQNDHKIKIACVGASITYGARIAQREQNSYPAQLQKMLGGKYSVVNYGISGTTLLRHGNLPYWKTKEYQAVLADDPNIVIIDLGGNDAKLINRNYYNEFETDYQDLIHSFEQLPSHPRIILLSAMASFVKDTAGIWDAEIVKQINPRIQHAAYTKKVEILDMHSPFINKEALFGDKLHPDKEGAGIMAKTIYTDLLQPRDAKFDITNRLDLQVTKSSFYGYECDDFIYDGRPCKVAKPKIAAKGHPWIWRARFWGHEPQTDIALLQQGFHVVYCDVAELLGNPQAITLWDNYYKLLHKAGLAKKAAMEGMSRGGVYVFNWAAKNPDKVSGVYVDNPLLNMSWWAGIMAKRPDIKDAMFEALKKDYSLATNAEIDNFKGSPVDKTEQIVKGKYPILILCADDDEAVSPADNTLLFEKKVKELNGNITVMHKPGFKHHPHSFPNPAPIVDFILRATGYDLLVPHIE